MGLKPQHMKAVNFYMKGYSEKEALLRAGFSESVANTNPRQVFGRDDVEKEIKRRLDRMREDNKLSEDWIVERLMQIAGANIGDLLVMDDEGSLKIDYSKLTPAMKAAIGGVEINELKEGRGPKAVPKTQVKIKMNDKLRALEMLMKILGLDRTKVEVSAEDALIEKLIQGRNRVSAQANEEDDEEDERPTG